MHKEIDVKMMKNANCRQTGSADSENGSVYLGCCCEISRCTSLAPRTRAYRAESLKIRKLEASL